jgi:hypothetical protein
MGRLIGVAVISALMGAGVTLWAKSTVLATDSAQAGPSSVRVSPDEITKAGRALPVEVFVDLN